MCHTYSIHSQCIISPSVCCAYLPPLCLVLASHLAMQQHHNQSEQPSLGEFLSSCGLEKLLPLFEQEEIDLPMLLTLDEKDLKEVGVR